MKVYRLLDLFSGIGGFSLGLECSGGFKTVAFCEIDPFCRRVLAKHWPEVPQYDDVRTLSAGRLASDGIAVDAICGGFPCQDISPASARKREGLDGVRTGLWSEVRRLLSELRPRIAILENSADLLSYRQGTHARRLFGDLAEIGYDAEWHVIPASAVGAPHGRPRVWIVAYPDKEGEHGLSFNAEMAGASSPFPYTDSIATIGAAIARQECDSWPSEPDVPRVAYGVPNQPQRRGSLGNAVVPQIPELIGRAIVAAEQAARA